MWIRGIGALQILLGLLIWTGDFDRLIGLHMLVGITLVLALWGLAGIAAASGVSLGLVAVGFVWGLVTPILGLTQTRILPNSGHWIIQILHLLVGIGLIGLGEILGRRIKSLPSTGAQAN
jgi:hypothetical protein